MRSSLGSWTPTGKDGEVEPCRGARRTVPALTPPPMTACGAGCSG